MLRPLQHFTKRCKHYSYFDSVEFPVHAAPTALGCGFKVPASSPRPRFTPDRSYEIRYSSRSLALAPRRAETIPPTSAQRAYKQRNASSPSLSYSTYSWIRAGWNSRRVAVLRGPTERSGRLRKCEVGAAYTVKEGRAGVTKRKRR